LSVFNELKRRNVFRVAIAYIVMAWLVMQVADVVLNNIEAPGWVFQTILLLLGIGFIVAMFFSWAFEMTPEGLKREHEVDRAQSITPQTGKKLNNLIFAVMGLALAYFAYDKFVLTSGRDAALIEATTQAITDQATDEDVSEGTGTSIAVLPFVNMSSDPEQEYFSDGISEEILNVLAQLPNLHVTSRSSAFQFKGDDIDIPSVAAQLGVEHVLEGSVRKSGNRVRITAQLIEAGQDRHLWSETYDRQLNDVYRRSAESHLRHRYGCPEGGATAGRPASTQRVSARCLPDGTARCRAAGAGHRPLRKGVGI
jgi:TolB-like protein